MEPEPAAATAAAANPSTGGAISEALSALGKLDLDKLAEALQLEEELLDEAEDQESEEAQKAFLRQCIVDLLGSGGSLAGSGFARIKARAKELGLSTEQIKTVTADAADKKSAVLRLIFDDALLRAKVAVSTPAGSSRPSVVDSTLPDGSTIEIMEDEVLGAGGGGLVTAALMTRRSGATEIVAAKRLPLGATEKQQQHFMREFEIATKAALECGGVGVCKVYGFIYHRSHMVIVMKKYKESLQDRFDRQSNEDGTHAPMKLSEVLTLALQLARALQGLHRADIRLQDLKPANILFDEAGVPVITDFGISVIQGATQATSLGGTSNYMCRELFEEENITPAVDIWSLAAVLVQTLTGRMPWLGMKHQGIMKAVLLDKSTPDIPEGLPEPFTTLLQRCFSHVPRERPTASDIVVALEPLVASLGTEQLLSIHANALLQGSWAKRDSYIFVRLVSIEDVTDPQLEARYTAYKQSLVADGCAGDPTTPAWENEYEQLLFHGCSEEALPAIASQGFLKELQTSTAGSWQRYGPGFYFALQSSKSHEYPPAQMKALKPGTHVRSMLLCRVAKGKVFRTEVNLDHLQGAAPDGHHSVLGIATKDGPLNYDEYVVYSPEAILPWLKCTYEFEKLDVPDPLVDLLDHSGIPAELFGFSRAQIQELLADVVLEDGGAVTEEEGRAAEQEESGAVTTEEEHGAVAEGIPEGKSTRALRVELESLRLTEIVKRSESMTVDPVAVATAEQGGKKDVLALLVNHARVVEMICLKVSAKMQALSASEDFKAMEAALEQYAELATNTQASVAYSRLRDRVTVEAFTEATPLTDIDKYSEYPEPIKTQLTPKRAAVIAHVKTQLFEALATKNPTESQRVLDSCSHAVAAEELQDAFDQLKAQANVEVDLFRSIRLNDATAIEAAVALGADVNEFRNGNTALFHAAKNGQLNAVRALIAAGADVNLTLNSRTPLLFAAGRGHLSVVRTLLEAGADVHKANEINITPVINAYGRGFDEVVAVLYRAGAKKLTTVEKILAKAVIHSFTQGD